MEGCKNPHSVLRHRLSKSPLELSSPTFKRGNWNKTLYKRQTLKTTPLGKVTFATSHIGKCPQLEIFMRYGHFVCFIFGHIEKKQ